MYRQIFTNNSNNTGERQPVYKATPETFPNSAKQRIYQVRTSKNIVEKIPVIDAYIVRKYQEKIDAEIKEKITVPAPVTETATSEPTETSAAVSNDTSQDNLDVIRQNIARLREESSNAR